MTPSMFRADEEDNWNSRWFSETRIIGPLVDSIVPASTDGISVGFLRTVIPCWALAVSSSSSWSSILRNLALLFWNQTFMMSVESPVSYKSISRVCRSGYDEFSKAASKMPSCLSLKTVRWRRPLFISRWLKIVTFGPLASKRFLSKTINWRPEPTVAVAPVTDKWLREFGMKPFKRLLLSWETPRLNFIDGSLADTLGSLRTTGGRNCNGLWIWQHRQTGFWYRLSDMSSKTKPLEPISLIIWPPLV